MNKEEQNKQEKQSSPFLPPTLIGLLADEVAKIVVQRLPNLLQRSKRRTRKEKIKKIENAVFLDTSAIIDGRIFDIVNLGFLNGTIVVLESILLELKHIADSQDAVKRERGRKGLEKLESLKRAKGIKFSVLTEENEKRLGNKNKEVDEKLIKTAKEYHGKVWTCDYNLEKKASIEGITAVNINALANCLKVTAVPGEALHVKVLHQGKDVTQGVGYLDDGTMIVIENANTDLGNMLDVVVSRVIQTTAGRILFAKKI